MNILRDFQNLSANAKGAVVALGNFDGVHLGHRLILAETVAIAKKLKTKAAVMTFEPHPREFFSGGTQKLRITSFRRKMELLREAGIEIVYLMRFNKRLAALSADAFIGDILHKQLAVRHIVTGYNFAFGKGRAGDTKFLAKSAEHYGFGFTACAPLFDTNKEPVSSSAIRDLLAAGEMKKAAKLLGGNYGIDGHVRHGDKRGRELGYPTINLRVEDLFKPRFGIYAARVKVDGKWHDAVASLGIRPMFDNGTPLLEAHVFAMNQNLYGKRVQVELLDFIREEKKFDSVEALKNQMAQDCRQAKEKLG